MTTAEEERGYWGHQHLYAEREDWECGEPWATAPTVGWLVENRPRRLPLGTYVDLGCGLGRLAEPIARFLPGIEVCGVDITDARERLLTMGLPNLTCEWTDGRAFPFGSRSCAYVWSVSMFQHIDAETVRRYIEQVADCLYRGGRLAVQFVEGGGPDADYHHSHSAENMAGWMRVAGLKLLSMQRGWLLPQWSWMVAEKP